MTFHRLVHGRRMQGSTKVASSSIWQEIATKKPLTHGEGKESKANEAAERGEGQGGHQI